MAYNIIKGADGSREEFPDQVGFRRLPLHLQTLYAELLETAVSSAAAAIGLTGSPGSFVRKKVRGREYLYYQFNDPGGKKIQSYVGPYSEALHASILKFEKEHEHIRSLASALSGGGGYSLEYEFTPALEHLSRTGCFLGGSVLVGTLAFAAYQNHFGIRWAAEMKTNDIDVAADSRISVAVPATCDIAEKLGVLKRQWEPLFKMTAAKDPPVAYKTEGSRIDFLTPMYGKEAEKPVKVPLLGMAAEPLRHLDFLIRKPLPAVIPTSRGGVFVHLPAPEDFAVHKMIVAASRTGAGRTKVPKDIRQADMLFRFFSGDDVSPLKQAWTDAYSRGPRWRAKLDAGLKKMAVDIQRQVTRWIPPRAKKRSSKGG